MIKKEGASNPTFILVVVERKEHPENLYSELKYYLTCQIGVGSQVVVRTSKIMREKPLELAYHVVSQVVAKNNGIPWKVYGMF